MSESIAVIGLGYVGLPVAIAFAESFGSVTGFDISASRIAELKQGVDRTGEISAERLRAAPLALSTDPQAMAAASFIIVTVPTPVDDKHQPDLEPLRKACESLAPVLAKGSVVVFESTVYPGVTEDFCGPILAQGSGLVQGRDFKLGYSPERINPGDREHTFERIVKVIAGEDAETTERIAAVYGAVVKAGLFRAASIRVAEAAKVIENTQRDLNIALMNELALIFDRLGLRTSDVLAAAGTKWNFLPFSPGLVGGHCIGVDPYYLTAKAESVGYHPEVILAGRRINNGMGAFVARQVIKLLVNGGHPVRGARVGVLGLTFKENVPDLRNSRVFDIVHEMRAFGVEALLHDPLADAADVRAISGVEMTPEAELSGLHALVLAVPHRAYMADGTAALFARLVPGGVLADVKSAVGPEAVPAGLRYWSL